MTIKMINRQRLWCAAVAVVFALSTQIALADTLLVPSGYSTIQAAIDAADPGDIVEIADGTYTGVGNKDLDFGGKAITVRSASGDPDLCIIDCEDDGRGFWFGTDEGQDSIVEGLTITNGFTSYQSGAGVYIDSSCSPAFVNCTISDNHSPNDGGGIYCLECSSTFTNCTIRGSRGDCNGSGVYCYEGDPSFVDCEIIDNERINGIFSFFGDPTFTNCTISGNRGSGVSCSGGSVYLKNCTISGNQSLGYGGGLSLRSGGEATLKNCTISGNQSSGQGSGLYCEDDSEVIVTNCTISDNFSTDGGASVYSEDSYLKLTNCILWGNLPSQIAFIGDVHQLTYCCVQGGTGEPWFGTGCIDADPHFFLSGDYHLKSGSPCVDSGTNSPAGGLPANDLDGNPRPLDGNGDTIAIADMGAYELNPAAGPMIGIDNQLREFFAFEGAADPADQSLLIANVGGGVLNWEISWEADWLTLAPTAGDSTGEADEVVLGVDIEGMSTGEYSTVLEITDPTASASPRDVEVALRIVSAIHVPGDYPTIQAAIDAAIDGDTVVIADGTYTGVGNRDLDFLGKAITVRSASGDPDLCIIDCEGEGQGFYFHNDEGEDSVVEGLTITNGFAWEGGGVRSFASMPTLINCTISRCSAGHGGGLAGPLVAVGCTIRDNHATEMGGGLACGPNSRFTDCLITGNTSDDEGGGVSGAWLYAGPILTRCTIRGNTSLTNKGGGLYFIDTNSTLDHCIIEENRGGGLYYYDESEATITNCVISNNIGAGIITNHSDATLANCLISDNTGAGLSSSYCDSTLTNCTIVNNSSSAGISCRGSSYSPAFANCTNCIVRGNTPQQVYLDGGDVSITYCNVEDGMSEPWFGVGCIDVDPLFVFPTDYHLMPGSPCIDAGTNSPYGGLPSTGLDDNPRPLDGDGDTAAVADMGVYELDPSAPPIISVSEQVFELVAGDGGGYPEDQLLSIRNRGGGVLNWNITGQPDWLSVVPSAGDSTGEIDEVTLSVDTTGLTSGTHLAILEVAAVGAGNTPVEVSLELQMGALHVPSQYQTIQDAIDAAVDGDVIEIADGIYTGYGNKDLDTGGKAIAVRSASGDPALCIIDCEGEGQGFHIWNGEGPGTIVEGLTITGGCVRYGGGIRCSASPKILRCTIVGNLAEDRGGGIYCSGGSPTLTDCVIVGNQAFYNDGGGVYCTSSSPALTNCKISDNRSSRDGGGLFFYSCHPTLVNCEIIGNTSVHDSGGVHLSLGDAELTNCTIVGNNTSRLGGGMRCDQCAPVLTNCILWGDSPREVDFNGDGPVITYSCVQGGAGQPWFGVGCIDVDPLFSLSSDYHLSPSSPCIDSGTNSPPGGLPADDIQGNSRPIDGDGDAVAVADMGAYERDPNAMPIIGIGDTDLVFIVPVGSGELPDQTSSIANIGGGVLNWEITWEAEWLSISPSTGDSAGEADLVTISVDADGMLPGTYTGQLDVVDPSASNSPVEISVTLRVGDTLYVPSQYATIQAAIDAAVPGDVVEIADGTYTGEGNRDLDFGGKAITVRSASGDPSLCVIDCERDGRGFYFHSREGADSIVEGLTITHGSANGEGFGDDAGGAVFCDWSNPTLINCVIIDNRADYGGGVSCGAYNNCNSTPTLINCTISNNYAFSKGAGVYGDAILTNCTISGNYAHWDGGGIYGNGTLINCIISGNYPIGEGTGTAIYGSPTLANCTIVGNVTYGDHHAIRGAPALTNCIVYNNGDNVIDVPYGQSPTATYCNIEGGTGESWFGVGCVDANPLFVDADGPDNDPDTWEDNDYRLLSGSPCIDAANNSAVPADTFDLDGDGNTTEPLPIDLDGLARFFDDPNTVDTGVGTPPIVDMGAYELHGAIGDFNGDEVVDLDDFDVFYTCMTGPGGVASGACQVCDQDLDNDVDMADFIVLQRALGAQ